MNKIENSSALRGGGGGSKGKNTEMKRLPLFLTLTLFLLPLFGVALYVVIGNFKDHSDLVRSSQKLPVSIAVSLVKEKLDRVVDMGSFQSERNLFRRAMEKGQWEDALKSIEGINEKFSYIDSVTLFDQSGILRATTVEDQSIIGKDFSYRDYYRGVSDTGEPYVSEVFKRAVEPKYTVVVVAIPIKSDNQKILGVLAMSIKANVFSECVADVACGASGSIYIVDQKGHLVVHPRVSSDSEIVDYSLAPARQKILKGESGVEILSDPMEGEKQLIAYAPIPLYGWGVAILQPESVAFSHRNAEAVTLAIVFALGIFIIGSSLYRVLKDRIVMKAQRDREAVFLESIGDGVAAIDRNWNITLWNRAASSITGWSREEALGKPLRAVLKILREHDRVEDTSCIDRAMITGKATSMSDSMLLVRKDGSEILIGDSAAPIFTNGKKIDGAIIVFRDISIEKEEMHLRSDFVYASHQFRTPVTEALWNLETAMDEENPEKRKEDLRIVHQSILSIKKLSEDIVAVSEIDQDNIMAHLAPVKLIDVLTEVQGKLEIVAKARNVTIAIAPVSPLVAINTDLKLLTRALFEIVENAVIYSPNSATVEVKVLLEGKEFCIEVADKGRGISEEEQVLIFTKFFRGSNRGKENVGDGLGLYIAKAYITLLGGKIWFKSAEGKGTTFFVSLPVA